jgi:glycosylphosphatidylinositol transamidase (GPIT) subunit GPI8
MTGHGGDGFLKFQVTLRLQEQQAVCELYFGWLIEQ